MAWTGLALTVDGQNALNNAQLSNRLNIKSIVIGDGATPANFRTLKKLVHQLYEIVDLKIDVADGSCTITADIPKMEYDYYFREIGVIVTTEEGEKLYVYDNSGDDAQYIVSTTGVESTRKRIRLLLKISDVAEITVSNSSILYVAYDDFEETRDKLKADIKNNADNLGDHINDFNNPHQLKAEQLGLDPTSDMDKPVSTAQQAALDAQYEQLTAYTRQKIAELIGGAPESADTLKEIHDAITANKTIMDALDAAIGKKASAAEFDSHVKDAVKHITSAERTKWNNKMEKTGDSANNTVTFTSGDAANPTGWADVGVVTSGEKHSSLMRKISLTIKNVRYLWKLLGSTSLAGIGDGTVTGAIDSLNTGTIYLGLIYISDDDVCDIAKTYNVPDLKTYVATVRPKGISSFIQGGLCHTIIGMEYNNHTHGYQMSFGKLIRHRILSEGTWGIWQTAPSDLDKINVRVLTAANQPVAIDGVPVTGHYIPVIIGHSISNNCIESVFWDHGVWYITSNYAQYTTLNFYKYPL